MTLFSVICGGVLIGIVMALMAFLAFFWHGAAPEMNARSFILRTGTAPMGARTKTRVERLTRWLYWLPYDTTQVYRARMVVVQRWNGVVEFEAVEWEDSAFADEPKRTGTGITVERVQPERLAPQSGTRFLNAPAEDM